MATTTADKRSSLCNSIDSHLAAYHATSMSRIIANTESLPVAVKDINGLLPDGVRVSQRALYEWRARGWV